MEVGRQVADLDRVVDAAGDEHGPQLGRERAASDDERSGDEWAAASVAVAVSARSAATITPPTVRPVRRAILRRAVTSDLAVSAATAASRQYASAPIAAPNSSFSGAPPTSTMYVSRRPFSASVSMTTFMYGIVVVSSADMPRMSGLWSFEGGEELVDVGVDAEVDDLEAGALEHHRHQVLADVVDVALDGADHDLADRFGAGLGEQRAQDLHPGLHRVGGEQHLGHEQDAVTEVDADDPHALDERVVQRPVRAPAAVEQDHRALDDLVGEPVVQVVVHLLDELVVVERGEIDLVGPC